MKTNEVSSMSSLAIAITIAGVVTLVLACGSSYPSESAGRRWLEGKLNPWGWFTVKSFTKTNGFGDDKHYTIEYKAELECQKVFLKCNKVGQVVNESGQIPFVKTENGWKAPDGNIY